MNSRAKEILRERKIKEQAEAIDNFYMSAMVRGAKAFAAAMLKIVKEPEKEDAEKIKSIIDICEKELKVCASAQTEGGEDTNIESCAD